MIGSIAARHRLLSNTRSIVVRSSGQIVRYTAIYLHKGGIAAVTAELQEIMALWNQHPELHRQLLQLLREHVPDPSATEEPPDTIE